MLCAQEIGIVNQEAPDFQQWARSRGWLSIIEPSVAGAAGATSAGAGIFVRDFLGLLPPEPGKTQAYPNRAAVGVVQVLAWPPLFVVSAYFRASVGFNKENREIAAHIAQAIPSDMPFIWAADFQVMPEALRASGLPGKIGATILQPQKPTCITAKVSSIIGLCSLRRCSAYWQQQSHAPTGGH